MVNDGLIDSYFSLAILRDVSGDAGYLTLGGLPPVNFTETWTTTDILITNIEGYSNAYDFYTIEIDEVTLNGSSVSGSGGSIQYIVSLQSSFTVQELYLTSTGRLRHNPQLLPHLCCQRDQRRFLPGCRLQR